MSTIQTSASASEVELTSAEPDANYGSGLLGESDDDRRDDSEIDGSADLGRHSLLSRVSVPQGRRSLFRR